MQKNCDVLEYYYYVCKKKIKIISKICKVDMRLFNKNEISNQYIEY